MKTESSVVPLSNLSAVCNRFWLLILLLAGFCLGSVTPAQAQFSFSTSILNGVALANPTSLQFGPDGRLYVSQLDGIIKICTVTRYGANSYSVTATEVLDLVQKIPNHNDDGTSAINATRQVTGILVVGTASDPIIYVTSSDPRWGGPSGDTNLDTNSGIVSRLTRTNGVWSKIDLIRGLPRSEENHSPEGMQFDAQTNTLYLSIGGNTNAGAPCTNFAYLCEYALSGAILSINLSMIDNLPTMGSGNTAYKYDLPTVNDPTRANNPDGTDINDPFGGNDGLNQAKVVPGGPVQIFASGFRTPYDLLITKNRRMYITDNAGNQGWGGYPDQEGPNGTATNKYLVGEPGSNGPGVNDPQINNLDNFHYVGSLDTYQPGSFYGGHPNPIRANPAGAGLYTDDGTTKVWRNSTSGPNPLPIDWPPLPLDHANPIEGDYRQSGVSDGALLTFDASTNGIVEYTASNFNNALKGSLLVVGFNSTINRITLTADGTDVTNARSSTDKRIQDIPFASGFGVQPLDIAAQGDNDIFPGTVWTAMYAENQNNSIIIFEPQLTGNCSGTYSTSLDDDADGYSNADEVDNATQPCSAASKPADFDHDLVSDLNDADDDNDGLNDNIDYFALDANNGLSTNLPVQYNLFNNDPGTGLFGVGFSGVMCNKQLNNNYKNLYNEQNLIAGGAVGAFTVVSVSAGDALGALNSQENGFQFGVNINAATGPFTVHTRMLGAFFNNQAPIDFQSQGFYIGTGDQDNYLKIVLNANGGVGGIEVVHEVDGQPTSFQYPLAGGIPSTMLDLYFAINPATGLVQPKYASNGGAVISLGSPIQLTGELLVALQSAPALAAGYISTSRGASPFTATWDFIKITNGTPIVASFIPDQYATISTPFTYTFPAGTFQDPNGDPLSYIASQSNDDILPAWLTFNGSTRTFSGTPPNGSTAFLTVKVTANNGNGGIVSDEFVINITSAPVTQVVYQLNSGGGAITNSIGTFAADQYFTSSTTYSTTAAIAGTSDDAIYQTERYSTADNGTFSYNLPVSNGQYRVILHFAELYWTNAGQRIFDVSLEGTRVLDNYDIVQKVGPLTATTESFLTTVNDGVLTIYFSGLASDGGKDNPKISAIEVLTGPATGATPVANAGIDREITLPTTSLQLNGSGTDADGTINGFDWSQVSGPNTAIFSSLTVAKPTVSGLVAGNYIFRLAVTDNQGSVSPSDEVTVVVNPDPNQAPVANAGQDISITLPTNSLQLNGTGTDADGSVSSFSWSQISGPNTANFNDLTLANPTVSSLVAGSYIFSLVVGDNQGYASVADQVTVTVNIGPNQQVVYRLNSGGGAITNSIGTFAADQYFASSAIFSSNSAIAGTTNDAIYQTERYSTADNGTFTYNLPVSNGQYNVVLHFAELYWTNAGQRIFDVSLEGTRVLDNYDIVQKVGSFTATTESFTTAVNDGVLTIYFSGLASDGGKDNPKISAIEVLSVGVSNQAPVVSNVIPSQSATAGVAYSYAFAANSFSDPEGSPLTYSASLSDNSVLPAWLSFNAATRTFAGTPTSAATQTVKVTASDGSLATSTTFSLAVSLGSNQQVVYRLNSGGEAITNSIGTFAADQYFSTSSTYSNVTAIAGTTDDAIYQTERYSTADNGTFTYNLPVSNGQYNVVLHFAELYWTNAGQRIFDVSLEGTRVLDNYDIVQKVGSFTATTESFTTTVNDGVLTIYFSGLASDGGKDNPKISAIEVLSVGVSNQAPVVSNVIPSQSATVGVAYSFAFAANSFSDPEGSPLTYSASLSDNSVLPAWLSFNAATRTFAGTPTSAATQTVKVTASDGSLATSTTFSLAVSAAANKPPVVLRSIPSQSATVGVAYSFTVAANTYSDPEGGVLTYSATLANNAVLPAWLSFNATTRTFTGTPTSATTQTIKVKVTDSGLLTGSTNFTLTVASQKVVSFTLINANNEQAIQTIASGATLNLATLPTTNLNIRANTTPSTVGSVYFNLTGQLTRNQTDNGVPYALFGETGGNYAAWVPTVGNYTLKGTPYLAANRTGTVGTDLTITFSVVNQAARIATIEPEVSSLLLSAYPNPVTDGQVNVSLSREFEGEVSYVLMYQSGIKLSGGQFSLTEPSSVLNFDFSREMASKGVYFLRIEGKNLKGFLKLVKP